MRTKSIFKHWFQKELRLQIHFGSNGTYVIILPTFIQYMFYLTYFIYKVTCTIPAFSFRMPFWLWSGSGVVNYYLVSLSFKFHEDSAINARARVINAHAHVLSRVRTLTTRVRAFLNGSS